MKSATETKKSATKTSPFPCYCCDAPATGLAVAYNRQGKRVVKSACKRHAWPQAEIAAVR